MNPKQIESRKKIFLEKWHNGDIKPTYEIRMKRLKDPELYVDTRIRVQ